MLKRIAFLITIIMVVIFMGACKNTFNNVEPKGEYEIITADEYNLKVKPGEGAIIQNYVDDAETAQRIADAVILSIVGEKHFQELTAITISYDPKKQLWIVVRQPKAPDGYITLGGDYTCAICRSNGEILKVWAGE